MAEEKKSPQKKRKEVEAKRKEWTQEEIDAAMGFPKSKDAENFGGQKHPGGRPSDYAKVDLEDVRKLASFGLTDIEIAQFLGISEATLYNWRLKHPEFLEALKAGKEVSDSRVEKRLFERAVGFAHEEEKVFYDSQVGKVVTHQTIKQYPPDSTAAIFWLKNRKPKEWRDTQHVEDDRFTELLKQIRKEKSDG